MFAMILIIPVIQKIPEISPTLVMNDSRGGRGCADADDNEIPFVIPIWLYLTIIIVVICLW